MIGEDPSLTEQNKKTKSDENIKYKIRPCQFLHPQHKACLGYAIQEKDSQIVEPH